MRGRRVRGAWGLALVLLLVMACTPVTPSSSSPALSLRDMAGRSVQLARVPRRVVGVGPGALRLIVYAGAVDRVVGVEGVEKRWKPTGRPYAMAHPEVRELPTIGPGGPGRPPDPEALLQVHPDLIVATYMDARAADALQDKTGIPVLVLRYGELGTFDERLFKALEVLGRALGTSERTRAVQEFLHRVEEDVHTRGQAIPPEERPRVYVGGVGFKGAHGIESTQAHFPPFTLVGVRNVADELGGTHHIVNREQILLWDPDVLFVDEGGLALIHEDVQRNPEFYEGLKAFREGRVYGLLPFNFYMTNVGTALADAYAVGKVLYPESFADVDPAAKADEIYRFLVGAPVYGEMQQAFGGFGRLDLRKSNPREGLPVAP